MINSTGVPAKNSFVQKERRQVWEVTQAYLGFIVTMSLLPLLWEKFDWFTNTRQLCDFFNISVKFGIACLGICLLNFLTSISSAASLNGITTQ